MRQSEASARIQHRLAPLVVILAVLSLSACSDVKRSLGYEKAPPDEFQVVQRAPLSMPPDFSLRPPQPGATRPQEGTTRDQARRVLTGQRLSTPVSTAGRTQGDVILVKRFGAESIQSDIRVLVNKESQSLAEAEKSFTDQLVFWRKSEQPGVVVDPVKESQRLRENQALGKSMSEGQTPHIERRKKAILEGIF
ncbi:DUF3035 domain-containing protein [Magnetospirillum molischianum]|uniref:DUF3035 domain-containing protein n=1 Tax=Magnetospirillum molischianum DSM 120 TaxID=1150626 RepID=H8FUL3_MAGML|nr:DUF3035 domain-containing protein [Magnetospirillum molischianum]CCG42051.1 conserved exported hypothetical protein [Magnetospirillum molischianum DSM 120]